MRKLYFKYPEFHLGANVTVRLGSKWDGYKGPVELWRSRGDMPIKVAEVVNTETKKFSDLTIEDIVKEHDPNCTNKEYLAGIMREVYGKDFDEEKDVVILTFVVE